MPSWYGIPALREIVPERWAGVVAGLARADRRRLLNESGLHYSPEIADLLALLAALPPAPDEVAAAALAEGPPVPVGVVARRERARQVNVRVSREDYEQLRAAAHIAGASPTQLARMLILGGTRKVLAEHGRSYAAVASGDD